MKELTNQTLEKEIQQIYQNKSLDFFHTYTTYSESETRHLATIFATYLNKGDILVLNGELGSGKTAFVLGIAAYFHIEDQVSSPTFTIVNEYTLPTSEPLFHFDVYRLQGSDDFVDSIGTDYFAEGICVIEWGNIIADILPASTIIIDITKDEIDDTIRYFKIRRNQI